ncbi:hypothetical protein H7J51_09740 [Mycobacterium crocinum]|uniref:Uncharacterized protein n=1 Tax=Mycolicibacterium crocinum TaxID=388459 RepID=A0ABY3TJ63_9MYCO|nr:hypothetical protein [Mycolicibacterium crocinum]MCV7215566.1 hypothetical protein [Mycolicibacterium crocinum]ULN39255.1 hypothetical protein MI149_15900 [Mycolicibacterium crocinum]
MVRIVSTLITVVAPLALVSCSGPEAAAPSPSPVAASSAVPRATPLAPTPGQPCHLVAVRDLIEWHRSSHPPSADGSTGQPASAVKFGNVNLVGCKSSLDGWVEEHSDSPADTAAGFRDCYEIAWADDNPGYDIHASPAPRLKNVLLQAGNDC